MTSSQPIAGPHLVTQQGNGGERSGVPERAGCSRPGRVVAVEQQLGQQQHDAGMIDPGQAEAQDARKRSGRILARRLAEAGVLTVGQAAEEHVRFGIFELVQGIHDLDLGPALLVALFRIDHQTIERGHEIADQFGNGLILDDPGRLRHDEAGSIREIAAEFQSGFRGSRLVAQGMKPGQLGIGPTWFLFPGHAVILVQTQAAFCVSGSCGSQR